MFERRGRANVVVEHGDHGTPAPTPRRPRPHPHHDDAARHEPRADRRPADPGRRSRCSPGSSGRCGPTIATRCGSRASAGSSRRPTARCSPSDWQAEVLAGCRPTCATSAGQPRRGQALTAPVPGPPLPVAPRLEDPHAQARRRVLGATTTRRRRTPGSRGRTWRRSTSSRPAWAASTATAPPGPRARCSSSPAPGPRSATGATSTTTTTRSWPPAAT